MKTLIDTTQTQINDLDNKMSAFVEMKDKATNVMPDIEKTYRNVRQCIQFSYSNGH